MSVIEKDGVSVQFVDVTPEMAREYLSHNTHNRPLRERNSVAYANDMSQGEWKLNGETVKFDTNGTLLDGQHRLAAIIEAGVPSTLLVVRGLAPETQETMDGGAKRKFSDLLALRGEPNSLALAAIIRIITFWEYGYRRERGFFTPTNAQLLGTYAKHPDLRSIAREATKIGHKIGMPPSVAGLTYWLFTNIDVEDTEAFFARLIDGQDMSKGDPIYELRKALLNSRNVRGERSTSYLVAITIKAWNKWRDGEKIDLLSYRRGGSSPEAFPEPH